MYTSKKLFEKIKEFEGCRLEAYEDAAGVWTIGYGHTRDVRRGDRITEYCAEEYLKEDLRIAEKQVLELDVCETQGQLDALTDFVFNLGIERLKSSTLLKVLRSNIPVMVVLKEFGRWVYADGKRLPGLVIRRNWEKRRFMEKSPLIRHLIEDMLKV